MNNPNLNVKFSQQKNVNGSSQPSSSGAFEETVNNVFVDNSDVKQQAVMSSGSNIFITSHISSGNSDLPKQVKETQEEIAVNPYSQSIFSNEMYFGAETNSIFNGFNKGDDFKLFSKQNPDFDPHRRLTQEEIANQKVSQGPKRTNPKAANIPIEIRENPYEAYRNVNFEENISNNSLGNIFSRLFTKD